MATLTHTSNRTVLHMQDGTALSCFSSVQEARQHARLSSLASSVRCEFMSAREHLISWPEAFGFMRARVTEWRALRRAFRKPVSGDRLLPLAAIAVFAAGAVIGGAYRPILDDRAMLYSETCGRSPVAMDGRFRAFTWDCRVADWWTYGDMPNAAPDACRMAEIEPTDANLEACYGEPIQLGQPV